MRSLYSWICPQCPCAQRAASSGWHPGQAGALAAPPQHGPPGTCRPCRCSSAVYFPDGAGSPWGQPVVGSLAGLHTPGHSKPNDGGNQGKQQFS